MLSLKELIVTYQANAKPVLDALNQIDAKIKNTTANLKISSQAFLTAGRDLSMSLTAPLALLGFSAVKASADFETLKIQMEVLTGSAEEGARVFQRLVKFAADTPFELHELATATNLLMGFGETADEAYDHLRLIGDIAAVAGGDFQGIALAFGQASAAGRLMGQDINQLVNNGVPVFKLLSDEMGVPKDQIKDLVSQGKVSFPILVRAFERATSKGGMFEGGMDKLSKTTKGVWSTFKDNLNISLAKFGDEMQKAFDITGHIEKFGKWIARLAYNFSRLAPETKKNIFIFLGIAAVVGPLLILIGAMVSVVNYAIIGFSALLIPLRLLVGLFGLLSVAVEFLITLLIANPIGLAIAAIVAGGIAIYFYWDKIVGLFKQAWEWINKISVSEIWKKVKDFTGKVTADIGFGAKNAISNPASSNSSIMNNQKTVQNNLTVNVPVGMSSGDSMSLKNAVKSAIMEQNRQSYMELAAQ